MKRALVSILAFLYLTVSTGATVHLHYCMGELVGASLLTDDSDTCSHCKMKKNICKKSCCKDENKVIKSSEHHSQSGIDIAFSFNQIISQHLSFSFYYSQPIVEPTAGSMNLTHAPPSVWRTCPIFIQIRDFRI